MSRSDDFCRMIFPVTDNRVADCRKLRSDLILQSGHQRNPDERGAGKKPLDGISKFRASRLGVFLCAQLLKHPFAPKIVNQSSFFGVQTPTNNRQITPSPAYDRETVERVSLDPARVFAKSRMPDVKRSMRWTIRARCLLSASLSESRDSADGVSAPLIGTAVRPAGLSMTTTASSS